MSATPEVPKRIAQAITAWYDAAPEDDLAAWDEIAAAIAAHVAARVGEERARHMRMHRRTNDLLRSCYMVAEREMDRPNSTSWDALRTRLRELLQLQRGFDATMPPTPEPR
jgi:hypothetical protein